MPHSHGSNNIVLACEISTQKIDFMALLLCSQGGLGVIAGLENAASAGMQKGYNRSWLETVPCPGDVNMGCVLDLSTYVHII